MLSIPTTTTAPEETTATTEGKPLTLMIMINGELLSHDDTFGYIFMSIYIIECLPLSQDAGRCGPNWGGRCDKNLEDWAVYCNLDNGWCGDAAAHMNAQSGDAYDWESSSCQGST